MRKILLTLRKCTKNWIVYVLILFPMVTFAQEVDISGKVTNEKQEPIPGVSVVLKGTTQGTITDNAGEYNLKDIPSDGILVYSYVGMETRRVDVAGQKVINVQLTRKATGLDEIVVVGYQIQKKADLTGAIETMPIEDIDEVSASSGNPMQALQGRVPGLYIEKTGSPTGSNNTVLVRGVNTLGDNNPLYIIDGIPTKRPEVFQSLSPGSISSVQVLKDASASSVYGARASNGVIIVETKDGSQNEGGVKVEFNSHVSMQTEKPQRYDMLDAEGRGEALWRASVNDGVDPASGYGEIYEFDWNGDFDNPVLNEVKVKPYVGGNENVPAGNTNWQEATYETGYVTNNSLTISGGNNKASALLDLGYIKNSGILKYTNYDRINARLNAQAKTFDDKVQFGMNMEGVSSNETLETPDLGSAPTPGLAVTLAPTIPVRTKDGEYAGPLGSGYSDRNNPVHMQYINRWDNTNRTFLFGNVFAEAELIDGLKIKTNLGIDYSTIKDKDIEQRFTEGFIARDVNSLTNVTSRFKSISWSNTLNYTFDIEDNNFSVLLGLETVTEDYSDVTAYKEDFAVQTEDYFVLSAGTGNGNSRGTAANSRLLSQFGKINWNYKKKYLASLTIRRDGSSRFGEDNRYGIFPAATLGWRISDESFMDSFDWLSDLKLRAGAGRVGNQDIGEYASLGLFAPRYGATAAQVSSVGHVGFFDQYWNVGTAYDISGANSGNLPSGFVSVQAANPSLKWETTEEINVGVDFSIMESKLMGAFDYFFRETEDILIQPPVASSVGEGQMKWVNGATKENKGWEFSLNYRGGNDNGFKYMVGLSFSHFKDKITELPEEVRAAYPGNAEKSILGESELSIFGYETDGIFQNQEEVESHADQVGAGPGRIRYKDLNNDGKIDALDQKFLGTTLPGLEYGLNIQLEYKNFDLSMFGSGVADKTGFDVYTYYNEFIRGRDNVGPGTLDAWTPQNKDSDIPALTLADPNNETRTSDYFMVNASYFKIRNLQLGYNLPDNVSNKIGFDNMRIYLMAENLFWMSTEEFTGPDPERTDINTIPIPTSYSLGLNISL
ncbi:MAG: TonB-dependent receptor [Bacteroidales bacterium]|nr:TonB-dependent receptor [Bacteroidales bacterium]MCF8336657.1 TonB-dependent receptor [Bacteroidales bacterium]